VGFDFDQGALESAFCRSREKTLDFFPLFLDAANPPSNQGWGEVERKGLSARADANGIIALALIHHLAIAKNIPLNRVVEWLVSLAPEGVVEFVPKQDQMVQDMLKLRADIFEDYTQEFFLTCLKKIAEVKKVQQVSASGRSLIWFARK
jgi:ribosomal protein L11 methylase PrmA